jgi:pimeloyl-ACP methyl ester carboxylesterase
VSAAAPGPAAASSVRADTVSSADGTPVAYHSVGQGPGLILVGGALSTGADYLPLARALAGAYRVHVLERRGRPGSGPQRAGHGLDDECADLAAVAAATGARAAFGHSFGGLVALEAARRQPLFDQLFLFEPGVPVHGLIATGWLDGYQRLLDRGDRRGAFAWMVKKADFAPAPVRVMPLWYTRFVLGLAIRGARWEAIDRLLEVNATEHRILAALDAPSATRFSAVAARTVLLGGAKSPAWVTPGLLDELAAVIPDSAVVVLPGLGHLAPVAKPERVAAALLGQRGTATGGSAASAATR